MPKITKKRHKENPFTENFQVVKTAKRVNVSVMGKENNVLMDRNTGEIRGTHIATYKKVDGEQFLKLFTKNIALTFDLTTAGIKALNVLMWTVQEKAIEKDRVMLDHVVADEFLEIHKLKLSLTTFYRGLSELEKAKIIASAIRQGEYFINPNFVFNGNRIAFSQIIEKREKTKQEALEDDGQERLLP